MSNSSRNSDGGFCGAIFVGLLGIAAFVWLVSIPGHALGLTPRASEVFNKKDGWVSDHYDHPVWGYVLTVLLIAGLVLVVFVWIVYVRDNASGESDRAWPLAATGTWVAGLIVAMVLPVGAKSKVEGNVPSLVGKSASVAEKLLDDKGFRAEWSRNPIREPDRCRVYFQDPTSAAYVERYSEVKLKCDIQVPNLANRTKDGADQRLNAVGIDSRVVNEPSDYDYDRCRVSSWRPTERVPPETTVALRLKCKPKKKEPEAEPLADYGDTDLPNASYCESGTPFPQYPGQRDGDGDGCWGE